MQLMQEDDDYELPLLRLSYPLLSLSLMRRISDRTVLARLPPDNRIQMGVKHFFIQAFHPIVPICFNFYMFLWSIS